MRLKIKDLKPADLGSYTCVAKNSLGEALGTIRVYEVPRPSTQTSDIMLYTSASKELSNRRNKYYIATKSSVAFDDNQSGNANAMPVHSKFQSQSPLHYVFFRYSCGCWSLIVYVCGLHLKLRHLDAFLLPDTMYRAPKCNASLDVTHRFLSFPSKNVLCFVCLPSFLRARFCASCIFYTQPAAEN